MPFSGSLAQDFLNAVEIGLQSLTAGSGMFPINFDRPWNIGSKSIPESIQISAEVGGEIELGGEGVVNVVKGCNVAPVDDATLRAYLHDGISLNVR